MPLIMNRLHRYKTPLLTTLLVTTFLVLPHLALAAGPGAVEGFFQDLLWTILVTITGTILWICAMLFDFSVNTFVIGFGNLFLGSGIGVAVDRIWFILRDFVNMFFIFGLVYIGFKLILDVDNSNTRRWLVNLVIAAILINFSLLITKTVVDFSNQLATQIAISGFGAEPITNEWGSTYKTNLADNILGLMGIKDLLSLKLDSSGGGGWGYIFGTAIFFLVTAFVLAAGAFLLMIRFIALTMFMLVSPLMFVSWVLPPVSDTMQRYWKAFIGRAFFAPIYFLFLYFSLETLVGLQESLKVSSGGGKWAKTFSTAATDATSGSTLAASQTTLPYFFIMCGFMIASLMIANKLGADGAKGAMSMGNSLKNKAISYSKKGALGTAGYAKRAAGAATLGAGASLGRNTIGRYGNHLASSDKWKNDASKSFLGRAKLKAAEQAAGASFDPRRVGGVGKALGIGEGKDGGYKKKLDDAAKKAKKEAEALGTVNVDSGDGKARADALALQNKAGAEADKNHATMATAEFEKDKMESEATLTSSIDALTSEIASKETDLDTKIAAGTLTEKEQGEAELHIADEKRRLQVKTENLEFVKVKDARLRAQKRSARIEASAASPEEKTEARDTLQKAEAAEVQAAKGRSDALKKQSADAESAITNAAANAKAAIKYERQIAFIQQQARSAERWSGKYAVGGAGSASAGTALGIIGGLTAGTGYGLVGAAAMSAKGATHSYIVKELEKTYGKDGVKKMKYDNRIQGKKDQVEAEADLNIGDKK